jgi:pectate lyase
MPVSDSTCSWQLSGQPPSVPARLCGLLVARWLGRLGLLSVSLLVLVPVACDAPGYSGGWKPNESQRPEAPPLSGEVEVYALVPMGWASVDDLDQNGTTGGGDAAPVTVATLEDFTRAVAGTTPAVVILGGSITGKVKIGSHKTVLGTVGAVFTGHLGISGSANVIVRDLKIVGNNCNDDPDCQSGDDAMTIENRAHHVWIDHCDISDGSDGNLDVSSASDYVTISWTKFSYSGFRPGGHQFSNLIGSSDNAVGDMGHLRVTFHHDWWADGVGERMPRARFGQIHLFNNLYTSVPNSYCVGLGHNANILIEDTVYSRVSRTVETGDFSNAQSVVAQYANLYEEGASPHPDFGSVPVFSPPYGYSLQPAGIVEGSVRENIGPH